MGGWGFNNRQHAVNEFIRGHEELFSEGAISPRIFRNLVDLQMEPLIECRAHLVRELSKIWSAYWEQIGSPENEATKQKLQEMNDIGTLAKDKHQELLKDVVAIVTGCAPRVKWKKHGNRRYQRELAKWIQEEHTRLAGFVDLVHNYGIKNELKAVRDIIAHAATILPLPSSKPTSQTSTANGALTTSTVGKRALDNDDSSEGDALPPSKKPKQQFPPGQWWGPNNSKLSCDDAFFDVIRQYKAYLANPSEQPGTEAYRAKMTGFLKEALDRAGLQSRLDDVLLKPEWDFRDPAMRDVRVPSFIQPGASEAEGRLGGAGFRGSNDFKTMLGGGLTAREQSARNRVPPAFQGMVALAHSSRSFREDNLSLRGGRSDGADDGGGGDNNDNNDDEAERNTRIRQRTRLLFRDPGDLWEQFLEDARYPPDVFRSRVEACRPPMMDPDRGGSAMKKYQAAMLATPLADEWDAIQREQDTDVLENKADEYLEALIESRRSAHRFIHRRPEHIFLDKPALNQSGGRDKPGRRYKGVKSRDFVEPIGHAFRARMYQVLRLAIYWRFYQLGLITLRDLLSEEKLHLEIWDQHEEMYMEWENQRFFTLKSRYEISELRNRYNARELLRKMWEIERNEIDKVIKLLDEDPHYYDNPSPPPKPVTPEPKRESIIQEPSSQLPKGSGLGTAGTPQPQRSAHATSTAQKSVLPQSVLDSVKQPSGQKAETAETQNVYEIGHAIVGDEDAGAVQDPTNYNGTTYNDKTPPDAKSTIAPGSTKTPDPTDGTDKAIEICERIRDAYEEKLEEAVRENNDLDIFDPGNETIINRNNMDVMAKQQVILGVNTEINNLKRPADPLAPPSSYGRGAAHKWELPAEDYWKNTRQISPKPELPLSVRSLGLGPMPGEHPSAADPRILIGAHSSFGEAPDPDGEMGHHAAGDDNIFVDIGRPQAVAQQQQPLLSLAGGFVESHIDHIPKDWGGFVALHQESLGAPAPTGTAVLRWDDWTESVFQALLASVRNLRGNFPAGSPFKGTDEDLRRYIQEVYRRSFGGAANHNAIPWAEREKYRHKILDDFATEVNEALRKKGLPATFPQPSGRRPPSSSAYSPTDATTTTRAVAAQATVYNSSGTANATQDDLRRVLEKKNEAKAVIRRLTRIQKSAAGLTASQQLALDQAKRLKREYKGLYKRLRAEADAVTRAQANHAAQEETNRPASGQAEGQQPAVTESDIDAIALDTTELEKAEDKVREASDAFKAAQEKANKAVSEAEKARAAAATTDDSYLRDLSAIAEKAKIEAVEAFHDAIIGLRLAGEAMLAQRAWDEPAETHEELRDQFATVNQGLDVWADEYQWDKWALNGRNAMDQWIIEVVSLVHEAYKAIGLRVTAQHWYDLYEDFWKTPGTSLVRMRAIWLFSLIGILNQNIDLMDSAVFIPTPPQPPIEWKGDPPPRAALLREADAELASRTTQKTSTFVSVPSPMPPAVTSLKADLSAAEPAPRPTSGPSPSPKPALTQQQQYHHQLKQRHQVPELPTTLKQPVKPQAPEGESKNKPNSTPIPTPPDSPSAQSKTQSKTTLLQRRQGPAGAGMYVDTGNTDYDDAWPDLKDLLQATWGSIVAHEALRQRPGDHAGVPPGRPLWPAPVRVRVDGSGPDPLVYYSL